MLINNRGKLNKHNRNKGKRYYMNRNKLKSIHELKIFCMKNRFGNIHKSINSTKIFFKKNNNCFCRNRHFKRFGLDYI